MSVQPSPELLKALVGPTPAQKRKWRAKAAFDDHPIAVRLFIARMATRPDETPAVAARLALEAAQAFETEVEHQRGGPVAEAILSQAERMEEKREAVSMEIDALRGRLAAQAQRQPSHRHSAILSAVVLTASVISLIALLAYATTS